MRTGEHFRNARGAKPLWTRKFQTKGHFGHKQGIFLFLAVITIIVLSSIIYVPSLKNGFIWDDDKYVYENELIQRPSGLKDIWFTNQTPQYYPFVFTAFWLGHKLWGLNPLGYHALNLFFHILNAFLIFLIIRRFNIYLAFAVALLFAIHPIQVETVAWITELKNIFSLFFFLLATLYYLRFDQTQRKRYYLLTMVFFVFALLSKSISVCFIFIPLLYRWYKQARITLSTVKFSLPFMFIGLLAAINTAYLEYHHVGASGSAWSLSFLERFLIAGRILFFYIYKVCFPFKFMFFYPRWTPDIKQWWQWLFPIIAIFLFLIFFGYKKNIGRAPAAFFSFYIISIFPALGFINVYPMRYSFVADHFSYLSLPFILLLLSWWAYFFAGKLKKKFKFLKTMPLKLSLGSVLVVIVIYLCAKSAVLTRSYNNIFVFWEDLIRKNPSAWMAYNNLGLAYESSGQHQKAIANYQRALEINPQQAYPYHNLGLISVRLGEYQQAIAYYQKAIEKDPNYADIYNSLAIAYGHLGQYKEALANYQKAIEINPSHIGALNNLGLIYDSLGEHSKAITYYQKAVKINSNCADIYNSLGIAHDHLGQYKEAIANYGKAVKIDSGYSDAYYNRGLSLVHLGQHKQAIADFHKATEINPDYAKAYYNLGATYLYLSQYQQAETNFKKAKKLFNNQGITEIVQKIERNLALIEKR